MVFESVSVVMACPSRCYDVRSYGLLWTGRHNDDGESGEQPSRSFANAFAKARRTSGAGTGHRRSQTRFLRVAKPLCD
jgi:hypothetical protein